MKSIATFGVGLAAGIALVTGYLMLTRERPKPQRPESDLARKELNTSRESMKKLAQRLAESEERNSKLSARLAESEKQPPQAKEPPDRTAEPKPAPVPPKAEGQLDVRKLAKSLLKMIRYQKEQQKKGGRWEDIPQDLMEEMMVMQTELMRFMVKAKVKFNDPYAITATPESRQLVADLASALLEEVGVSIDKARFETLLEKMSEGSAIHKDKSLSELEKTVRETQLQMAWTPEFEALFTAEQREKVRQELGDDISGGLINLGGGQHYSGYSSNPTKDKSAAADSVLNNWSQDLQLNDSEKQLVRPMADRYVQEYVLLRQSAEAEYGLEFMAAYADRNSPYLRGDTAGRRTEDLQKELEEFQKKQRELQSQPGYKSKEVSANLKFLELQLKYQKELQATLGAEKAEPIKKMRASVQHFPNLE